MPTIDEHRSLLSSKLKEMAEDGISPKGDEAVAEFDPPLKKRPSESEWEQQTDSFKQTREKETIVKENPTQSQEKGMTMEEYRSCFFQPSRNRQHRSVGLSVDTLDILRNILHDLDERTPISSYIDRILREHLRKHQDLLNNACTKQRRKTTIQL
ncbi:DUF3408 domain-containing protein [Porphyromonas loveana]|uniref:Uncharacterized protein DUF3408 n=1 Tax=Porphyromonas loveana TaxID=1884669 RepID=A0A2U1FMD6_9PORP|nr:DUF3408 domain-containing protein [Porphyromonas loveana]PVZ13348.1 uncharacterized protein DUF3408 [Porphyromonas loveana]